MTDFDHPTLRRFAEEHASLNEHQRALREAEVWDVATKERLRKSGENRGDWFAAHFGGHPNDYQERQTLLHAGLAVQPLWDRVLGESMPVTTALKMLRQCRRQAIEQGRSFDATLAEILAAYDRMPLCSTSTGKMVRKNINSYDPLRTASAKPASPPKSPKQKPSTVLNATKEHYAAIRQHVTQLIALSLRDVDAVIAAPIAKDFEVSLRTIVDEFQGRINRTRERYDNVRLVPDRFAAPTSFTTVQEACLELRIEPPQQFGERIDMARARKNYRDLSKKWHPDMNPDDPTAHDKYVEIQQHWSLINDYIESLNAHPTQKEVN